MNNPNSKMNSKPRGSHIASKIPTSGRDSGTHSRSSSVSNLTTASDIHSEIGEASTENVEDFKVDEKIWVNGTKSGVIKFIGKTQFAPGIWAGVLLDEPVGKNDGSVSGVQYFVCEPLRGIFTRPNKLTRSSGALSGTGDATSVGAVTPKSALSSSRLSVRSNSSTSPPKSTQLRVGDRVTVSSLGGLKPGTLRFIGETDFAKGEWAGIELDEPTGKNDGSVAGKRYFMCQMKYGLFSPLHKVSRAAVTPTSRPASARSSAMIRSNSRDSLNSSISTSSRASRVKLGVTSLSNTQKIRSTPSSITTASKALQEALKEKEQHIEQLLKERDIDRTEIARISSHFEEVSAELGKKQSKTESSKRRYEEELNTAQRKLEDIQFQLEEEKIMKSELEMKLNQTNMIVKRIEDFVSKENGEKFLNIKEILLGQEILSELDEKSIFHNTSECSVKVSELESSLKRVSEEKDEILKKMTELQTCSGASAKNEVLIGSLNTTIQEKDDMISNLKNELNNYIEKVTNLIEDNKNLSEQIMLKEEEAKGHANDVIKELGEKIILLDEEIKAKSNQLNEYQTSIQEKDNLISSMQESSNAQAITLSQFESEIKEISEKLKGKEFELNEKIASQQSLADQMNSLKSQNESGIEEKEKKILDLVKEIEHLTNCIQEKDDQLIKTQTELAASKTDTEKLNETIQQLLEKIQNAESSLSATNKDVSEKVTVLENEISVLKQEKDQITSTHEKDLDTLKNTTNIMKEELQAKNDIIVQHETQISSLTEKLMKNEEECSVLKDNLVSLSEKRDDICKEKDNIEKTLRENEEMIAGYKKDIENLNSSLSKHLQDVEGKDKELKALQDSLNVKEEENNQLTSKLQLAEQKVDMLNKDSSEHVMSLQSELSKIKEESTTVKTHLEQEVTKMKCEKEKLASTFSEKEKILMEKEDALNSLEGKMKEKDSELSQLCKLKEELSQTVAKCNADSQEKERQYEELLKKSIEEYDTKLTDKEKELLILKDDSEKLLNTVNNKDKLLLEKEEVLSSLEKQLKEKELEISDLSNQKADLIKNIEKFNVDIQEQQKVHDQSISSSLEEHENKLKEKEQIVQDIQNQLKNYADQLQNKDQELSAKEGEITSLKNIVQLKESQFDELSQMIESSQSQLILLKEQNEKNVALLESKESFINDFKTDQENKLQLKEESFKEEVIKLQSIIQNKDDEMSQKDAVATELLSELQEQKKLTDSLKAELENVKEDKKRASNESSNVYQQLNDKVTEMEKKYSELLQEKEKIAKEEMKNRDAKESLELVRDSLLQEKSAQEQLVKDREAKLEALQAEVNRMQAQFTAHKQDLQEKLDVSKLELQAALELKNELGVQHSILEELQQQLDDSNTKCEELEAQVQIIPAITSEKNQLQTQMDEFKKLNQEKSEMISNMENRNAILEEQLQNNKNLCLQKEKEVSSLKDKLQKSQVDAGLADSHLKEENASLKNKIQLLELAKSDKKSASPVKTVPQKMSSEDAEEKESLLSQVDFLNSIIVDMKQKNEELIKQLEIQRTCWDTSDLNQNDTKKAVAPRLFCDICDMFDLHETCDCPKQESFVDDEEPPPQLKKAGTRKLEERPYCNNCEVFGHWTLDCDEPDTF